MTANDLQAVCDRAATAFREGRFADAAEAFEQAINLAPDMAQLHLNHGVALKAAGNAEAALSAYNRALAVEPSYAAAHYNKGNLLREQGGVGEAVESYRRAAEHDPHNAEVFNNLGSALDEAGEPAEALNALDRALLLRSDFAEAHNNRGNVLQKLGRLDGAEEAVRQALFLDPGKAQLHLNRAGVFQEQGRLEEALRSCRQALELDPGMVDAHLRQAMIRLLTGDLEAGWEGYEWRWRRPGYAEREALPEGPVWDGGSVEGKRVLVRTEQGFGDSLQFIRYAALLAEIGAQVTVQCEAPLVRLFRTVPGIETAVSRDDTPPTFDMVAPLLSAPRMFRTTSETIPGSGPYLTPDADLVADWGRRMEWETPVDKPVDKPVGNYDRRSPFRVGICWRGNPQQNNDLNRSMVTAGITQLLDINGIEWVNLQLDITPEDRSVCAFSADPTPHIRDFADTAAVMAHLDLVVSVDTAVAHLAGALGRPVWILLCRVPDWRYGMEGTACPWYPTARLFRQESHRDWAGVVERVRAALG